MDPQLGSLLARFSPGDIDLVLAEGFSHEAVPKIEVFRPAHGRAPRCWPGDPDVVAIASDADLPVEPPVARDAVRADFLERVAERGVAVGVVDGGSEVELGHAGS